MYKIFQNKKIVFISVGIIVVASLVGMFVFSGQETPEAEAAWFYESWLYRRELTIDSTYVDSELTNFPIAVQFTSSGSNPYSNTQADGRDIRFTDPSGNPLKYEIESWDESGTSTVWVKIPNVNAGGDTKFYMYYGNAQALDTQDPEAVWDDNFLMVQHLEESDIDNGTNDIKDSTANQNHATTAWMDGNDDIEGQLDGGFDLDGSNDQVNFSHTDDYNDMTAITVCAWAKPLDATDANENLITKWHYTATQDLGWTLHRSSTNDAWRAEVAYNDTNSTDSVASDEDKSVGQWQYVCFTWETSAVSIFVGKSGTGLVENSTPISRSSISDTAETTYGSIASQADGGNIFEGQVDEVRISKIARSSAWIKAEFYNGEGSLLSDGGEEQGVAPLSYWSFDEGYGQSAYDYASGGIDGELGSTNSSDANDPEWVSSEFCKKGGCLKFDGDDDYVGFGYQNDVHNNSGSFTFSLWSRGFGYQNGVSHSDGGHGGWMGSSGSRGVAFGPDDTGDVSFWVPNNSTTLTNNQYVEGSIDHFGDWVHWAYVYDADNQLMLTYKDGVEVKRSTSADGVPSSIYTGNTVTVKIGERGDGLVNWDGYIDEVKYYNYARSADQIKQDINSDLSINFSSYSPTAQLTHGLVGWWKLDESGTGTCSGSSDACDETQYDNHGTWEGGAVSSTDAVMGLSMNFNGSTDYVSIPDSDSLDITESVTLAAWVNFTSTNSWDNIIGKRESSNSAYQLERHSTNNTYMMELTGVGSIDSSTTIATGEWHHVAGVWDDVKKEMVIYVDGVLEKSVMLEKSVQMITNDSPVNIGRAGSADLYYLDGKVDDARIYNRALSPDEIERLYQWRLGPMTWLKFDDRSGSTAYDSSTNGADGTINSGTWKTGLDCRVGSCIEFSGDNTEYTTTSADYPTGTAPRSICAWVKATNTVRDNNADHVVNYGTAATLGAFGFMIYQTNTWWFYGHGGGVDFNTGVAVDTDWHHHCVTYDGATVNYYYDGYVIGSGSRTLQTTASNFTIAHRPDRASGNWFDGRIDDVRVYEHALSAKEVHAVINGSGNDTALAYWSFDEGQGSTTYGQGILAGKRNGSSANNGALTNMSTNGSSTAWTTYGKQKNALQFDGVDDYIAISDSAVLRPGNESWSVSLWARLRDEDQISSLLSKSQNGGDYESWSLGVCGDATCSTSGKKLFAAYRQSETIERKAVSAIDVVDGKWHHYVAVADKQRNKIEVYLDGVKINATQTTDGVWPTVNNTDDLYIGYDPVLGAYTSGTIDEVRLYNYALSLDEIRRTFNQGNQATLTKNKNEVLDIGEGLVGWWKMDEESWGGVPSEVRDYSGFSYHGTSTNAVTTSTAKYGRAAEFDGSSAYIDMDDVLDMADHSFTVSGWAKTSDATTNTALVTKSNGGGAASEYGFVLTEAASRLYFYAASAGGAWGSAGTYQMISSAQVSNDEWYHFAVVFDVTDTNNTSLYINGEDATVTRNGNTQLVGDISNAVSFAIGAEADGGTKYNGILDDIRIYASARTKDQIAQEYTEGPPEIAYWKFDDKTGTDVVDSSGNGYDGSFAGSPEWGSAADCHMGSCLTFDGSSDYVDIDNTLDFDGIEPFSMSAWVKIPSDNTQSSMIIAKGDSGGNYTGYSMFYNHGSTRMEFNLISDDSPSNQINRYTSMDLADDTWHHILFTYDGSRTAAGAKIYKDGTLTSMTTGNDNLTGSISNASSLNIGARNDGNLPMYGSIDEVKIWDYELTVRQVAQEYNNGGPYAYYKFDTGEGEIIYDYSGNGFDGTLVVGTGGSQSATSSAWSNGVSGKVNGSINFDGNDDHIDVTSFSGGSYTYNTFSISAWYKSSIDTSTDDQYIWLHQDSDTFDFIAFGPGDDASHVDQVRMLVDGTANNGTNYYGTSDVVDQTWHHLAVVRTESKINIYVDGVLESSTTDLTAGELITISTVGPYIGDDPGDTEQVNGQVDEFKFWNYDLTDSQIQQEYNNGYGVYFE